MTTYLYATEIVKKDAAGNYSVADLTVATNSTSVTSGSTNTEFTVNGVSLGPVAPTLYSSTGPNRGTVTLQNGAVVQPGVMSFMVGADEYYILQGSGGASIPGSGHVDPNRVTDVVIASKTELVNAYHSWVQFQIVDQSATTYQGNALLVVGSTAYVERIYATDDDPTLELSSTGSVETGLAPHTWSAGAWGGVPINLDSAFSTTENIVKVSYTTATGSGTFKAIATSYSTRTYYIPKNGNLDLDTITGITGVVETATAINGSTYSDFNLTTDKFLLSGDASDNLLFGDIGHDKILGKGGADTMFGDVGDDLIKGGAGKDTMYGGAGVDKMFGQGGRDTLFGGMGDDIVKGGNGNDTVKGGAGNDTLNGNSGDDTLWGDRGDDILKGDKGSDTLKGGAGNDVLKGGAGNDILKGYAGDDQLIGGKGSDTMTGGGGADTFVIKSDGKTDTITDFQDGVDLIDIDVAFANLIITNGAAGEVLISHSGETLIVQDNGLGLLTAADLTAADFL